MSRASRDGSIVAASLVHSRADQSDVRFLAPAEWRLSTQSRPLRRRG